MEHTRLTHAQQVTHQAPILSVNAVRSLTEFGRTLSYRVIDRLPHLTIGKRKLVNSACLDAYIKLITLHDADVRDDLENPNGLWSQVVSEFRAST